MWTIGAEEAGLRLDKFLAGAGRLGSRARAATALERGKVFLNGAEVSLKDAARPLVSGDTVPSSGWIVPAARRRQRRTRQVGDLDVIYEDELLIVVNKPAGILTVPLERKTELPSVYEQIEERFRSHGKRRPFRGAPDRPGHVRARRVRQGCGDAEGAQGSVQAARARPRLLGRRLWHSRSVRGNWRDLLVWDDQGADPEGNASARSARDRGDLHLPTVERFSGAASSRFGSGPGGATRSASRPGCADTRWSARSATSLVRTRLRPIPFGRQALHAWRLSFLHPAEGRVVQFEAPAPGDFAELLTRLRRAR